MNRPYPQYHDSGVEWLGQIPEHWDVWQTKNACSIVMGQSPPSSAYRDEPVERPFLQGNAEFGKVSPTSKWYCDAARKSVDAGAILLSVRAPVGALNVADRTYGIGRGLCGIVVRPSHLKQRFAWWALHLMRIGLDSLAVGSTYDAVSVVDVGEQPIPLPPLCEQQAIAAFLDRETGKVDALVEQQERLLERLAEYRASLISHTVTKGLPAEAAAVAGLDPYPQYRDSGVEWLGQIPVHWDVRELGRMGAFFKGKGGTKRDAIEGGVPCIRYGDLFTYDNHIRASRAGISEENTSGYRRIQRGDVLFAGSSVAPKRIGKSAVNLIGGRVFCGGDVIIFRPLVDVDKRFIGYATHSHPSASQKLAMSRVVTVAHIYGAQLQRMVLSLPPLDEQQAIATFLDRAMTKLDELVSQVEVAVERLLEYRSALITHTVTGRIDVRGSVVAQVGRGVG